MMNELEQLLNDLKELGKDNGEYSDVCQEFIGVESCTKCPYPDLYCNETVAAVTAERLEKIMQKYNWIISHKDEAKELAKQSQNIFIKKFCLEKQLSDVWKEHNDRKRAIEKSMYAQNREEKIFRRNTTNSSR